MTQTQGAGSVPAVVYLPVWLMFSITGDLQDSLCSACSSVPSTAAERRPSTTGRQTPRAGRAPAAGWSSGTGTRGKPAPLETDGERALHLRTPMRRVCQEENTPRGQKGKKKIAQMGKESLDNSQYEESENTHAKFSVLQT